MSLPARSHMSIGEVLGSLRADFPDVTISKIRFLEAAGLVEPSRTPGGYRKFSAHDLERLHHVLTAQRDHYLPLKVIKEQLDAIETGAAARARSEAAASPFAVVPAAGCADRTAFDDVDSDVRLSRADILAETGLDEAAMAQLDESGLLHRRRGGYRREYYDADDLVIARIVAAIGRFGLEPRHLRAFKGAADREAGLVEQAAVSAGRARGPDARARAEQSAAELTDAFVRLHEALLRAGVRRALEP